MTFENLIVGFETRGRWEPHRRGSHPIQGPLLTTKRTIPHTGFVARCIACIEHVEDWSTHLA